MPKKIVESELKKDFMKLNKNLSEDRKKQYQFHGYYYEEVDGKLVLRNTEEQNENSTY